MKLWKQAASLGIAAAMMASAPLAALAASPEFSRTEEEWAALRDDVIEYGELAGLIHEYNATVQKNQIDYNEFRKEYGDTNDEVAERYRQLADEIESNLSYPDVDDAGYAAAMGGIISSETQIDSYRKQADEAVDDSTIQRLTFDSAEATLVTVAQSNMIAYYQNQIQLEIDQKKKELAEENYRSAQTRQAAGMATETEVLTAKEAVQTAEQALLSDQSSIDQVHQKLLVMLGWKHDDQPQIMEIPPVDQTRLAAMDPAADKAAALENNYALKISKRKLENAKSTDTKESLERTIREQEQNIGAALTASYQNVTAAKTAYDLAAAQNQLEQQNLQTAERQYTVGSIGRLEYLTQKNTAETAALNVRSAELGLFQAMETYDWAVNGLASVS